MEIFTAKRFDGQPKVVTKMLGDFNCNHLFRQTKILPHIVVYSDARRVVLHPLGEPGVALGQHLSRVSHLMAVCINSGYISMNPPVQATCI